MAKYLDEEGLAELLKGIRKMIGEPKEETGEEMWLYDNFSVNVVGADTATLNAVTLTVTIDRVPVYNAKWSGYIPGFRAKPGQVISITSTDLPGYFTPAPVSFTAIENAVRCINLKYVKV